MTTDPSVQRRVFKDPALDEAFHADGYVLMPWFGPDEVADLLERFAQLGDPDRFGKEGFLADVELDDVAYKWKVFELLSEAYAPKMQQVLDDYVPFLATYITKAPGADSDMSLHQDWNFIDERRFRSAFIWTPLVDTSAALDNGPIYIAAGTHQLDTLRGGGTLLPIWDGFGGVLEHAGLRCLDVAAGDAVIWDPAVAHYSSPNRSDQGRPVTLLATVPREADLCFFFGEADGKVTRVEADAELFIEHSMPALAQGVPEGARSTVLQDDRGPLTEDEIVDCCAARGLIDPALVRGDEASDVATDVDVEPVESGPIEPEPFEEPPLTVSEGPADTSEATPTPTPMARSLATRAVRKAKRVLRGSSARS